MATEEETQEDERKYEECPMNCDKYFGQVRWGREGRGPVRCDVTTWSSASPPDLPN